MTFCGGGDFLPSSWVRRKCRDRSPGRARRPTTDSEHAKCGGVRRRTDSVLDFPGSLLGAYEDFEFFGLKILAVSPIGLNFGPVMGESCAHTLNFLLRST